MWLLLVCWGSPRVRGPEDIQISRPCWLASSWLARPSHKPASFRMKTCRKRRAKKTIAAPQIKILYWHLYHIVVCLVSVINDHPFWPSDFVQCVQQTEQQITHTASHTAIRQNNNNNNNRKKKTCRGTAHSFVWFILSCSLKRGLN